MSSRYSQVRHRVSSNFNQGFNNSMDELPDEVVWAILERMNTKADRISISITCKRFYVLDNDHRKSIRLHWGNVGNKELLSLCKRFKNLQKVEMVFEYWKHEDCEELGDKCLYNLSIGCPLLADLSVRSLNVITDTGLSHLASCSNLSALKLMFAHRITGRGMSSVVVGCRKLASIHLGKCSNIVGLDWLDGVEKLEDLCIKDCKAIDEGDLIKLGPSWQTLKRLQFDLGIFEDRNMNFEQWECKSIPPCDNMLELILVRRPHFRGGLSSILGKCRNLEKIHLDASLGVEDSDIIALTRNSTNLRTISLRVPSNYYISVYNQNHTRLTDESLKALAQNCSRLESIRIALFTKDFPSDNSFSIHGILDLVCKCPIRELTLEGVDIFNDSGMRALCGAESLEMLELIDCNKIRDVGIQLAAVVPQLRVLKLTRCRMLTDNAFKPLRRRRKLKVLAVSGCRYISEEGVKGAAISVSFSA